MGTSFQLRIDFAPGLAYLGEATGSVHFEPTVINL
jgi:hypothetical protein